jgi:hypothetical protein
MWFSAWKMAEDTRTESKANMEIIRLESEATVQRIDNKFAVHTQDSITEIKELTHAVKTLAGLRIP